MFRSLTGDYQKIGCNTEILVVCNQAYLRLHCSKIEERLMHSEPVIKLITLNHNNNYQLLGLFHEFATLYRALGIACLTFDLSPLCEFQIF